MAATVANSISTFGTYVPATAARHCIKETNDLDFASASKVLATARPDTAKLVHQEQHDSRSLSLPKIFRAQRRKRDRGSRCFNLRTLHRPAASTEECILSSIHVVSKVVMEVRRLFVEQRCREVEDAVGPLFEMKPQKVPAYWQCIRLVAKHEYTSTPTDQFIPAEMASSAFCLMYMKLVQYRPGGNDVHEDQAP